MADVLTGRRTIGETHLETLQLIERLRQVQVGGTVSYAQMTAAAGRDVQTKARHNLRSARAALLREGYVFDVVRGSGLVRLTGDKVVATGGRTVARVRRASKRELRRQATVNPATLEQHERLVHGGLIVQLSTIIVSTSRSVLTNAMKRIEKGHVPQLPKPADLSRLMRPRATVAPRAKK